MKLTKKRPRAAGIGGLWSSRASRLHAREHLLVMAAMADALGSDSLRAAEIMGKECFIDLRKPRYAA
jgi:hypothetical protein